MCQERNQQTRRGRKKRGEECPRLLLLLTLLLLRLLLLLLLIRAVQTHQVVNQKVRIFLQIIFTYIDIVPNYPSLDKSDEEIVSLVVAELEQENARKEKPHAPTQNDKLIEAKEKKLDELQAKIEELNLEQSRGNITPDKSIQLQSELFCKFRYIRNNNIC